MLSIISAAVFATGLAVPDSAELRREDLMTALKQGGYTVVLRHARTDRSFQEPMGAIPRERREQRNLSDDGFRDAALMGVVFRKYGIAFAEIVSSPMFRTVETAEMAAGKPTSLTMALRVFPSTAEQERLVKTAPKKGTNRLLVTHHFVIETHVPGIRPGDIAESEAVVIRHAADGTVEVAGRITLDDWHALANPEHRTAKGAAPPDARARTAPYGGAGAHTTPGTPIPDTHAGHLAREYLAAFNSGSDDRMRAFIAQYMEADRARPTAERIAAYRRLFEQHGTLTVTKVEASASTDITLSVTSRQGDVRMVVQSSDAQPMRIARVTFTFLQGGGHR